MEQKFNESFLDMKKVIRIILFYNFLFLVSSIQIIGQDMNGIIDDYPSDSAIIFAPDIISTQFHEHSFPAISPGGDLILWNSGFLNNYTYSFPFRILYVQKQNGSWTNPAYFHSDFFFETSCASFSPNGRKIFFCGDTAKNKENRNADIWYSEKVNKKWSAPKQVSGKVNTPKRESQVSVTSDGTLYFLGFLEGVKNNYGIYRSRLKDGMYQEPEALPSIINSELLDWTPFISPDESYLLFSSYREGGYGSGDIWISFRDEEDNWSVPVNLGPKVNGIYNERFPYVSPDGKYLFFLTDRVSPDLQSEENMTYRKALDYFSGPGNGQCDIYWISVEVLEKLKPNRNEN